MSLSAQEEPLRLPAHKAIKLCKNGDKKPVMALKDVTIYSDVAQMKRHIMKKLSINTYEDKVPQQQLRLFSLRGIEFYDYDSISTIKDDTLFYSHGDDFNYTVRLDKLQFRRELGSGGFGTVNLVYDKLRQEEVAVKLIDFRHKNGNANVHLLLKEVEALCKLSHKSIVELIEYFPHPEKDQLVVIMEYLKGGDLNNYWQRFQDRKMPETEARDIMRQVVKAIDYCHGKKIIHRDLKFQNIMLVDQVHELAPQSGVKIKIVDFGIFGSNRGGIQEKSTAGSVKFMAPELFQGRTHSTPKIDVWSLGCMLHALILGVWPFSDPDREQLKKLIQKKEITAFQTYKGQATPQVLQLIDRMLAKQPEERISLLDILHDPWFRTDDDLSIDLQLVSDQRCYYDESPLQVKHTYETISPLKRNGNMDKSRQASSQQNRIIQPLTESKHKLKLPPLITPFVNPSYSQPTRQLKWRKHMSDFRVKSKLATPRYTQSLKQVVLSAYQSKL